MYETTMGIHSLSVNLNRLPPLNPNSPTESVARVNFTLALGDGSFITHRGVHLIKTQSGGMFLSHPGKRRGADNAYIEFASVTGPLLEALRSAATAEYRRLTAPAARPAPTAAPAQPAVQAGGNTQGRQSRIFTISSLVAEVGRMTEEFSALGDTTIGFQDQAGHEHSKVSLLAHVAENGAPLELYITIQDNADGSIIVLTQPWIV